MAPAFDDDATSPVADPLERAARHVLRAYAGNALVADEVTVRRELTLVVEGVRAAMNGGPRDQRTPGAADRLGLLRSFRSAVVDHWTDEDGSILPVMRAIEVAQQSLLLWGDSATVTHVLHPFSRNLLREVAHLLRSPLGSIVLLTDTLLDERSGPLSDVQRRQLGIIHRAALGVASVAGDLLVLVNEEQRSAVSVRFDVAALLRTIADVVRPVAAARGSELVTRCSVDGSRTGPVTGLGQALLGLALRAALGTRDGRVEVAAEPMGDHIQFSVIGHGGAEREGDASMFTQVFRLDADGESFTLSADGLGMEASRRIIEAMGSELESRLEPGAISLTFRAALPLAE